MNKQFKRLLNSALIFMLFVTTILGVPQTVSASTPTPVLLSSLIAGNTVIFGGITWIVLDPSTGYLLMESSYLNLRSFDGNNTQKFDQSDSNNIAWYLNNTFYDTFDDASKALIQFHPWSIRAYDGSSGMWGDEETVNCRVGLLSLADWHDYSEFFADGFLKPLTSPFWTLTPDAATTNRVYAVTHELDSATTLLKLYAIDGQKVRPALYLNPNTPVLGGNGGTVLVDQAAPIGLKGIAPTSSGGNDGKITGTTTEMEYKLAAADDLTFADCTDTETTGLEAGDYVVRYAAKPGYNAGAVTAVTVPAYTITLSSLQPGNTVTFGGKTWIVLNPSTGYLLMQGFDVSRVFGPNNTFSPQSGIGQYLNNDFYDSLPALIQSHSWGIGGSDPITGALDESSVTVNCKVGMISYSEWNSFKSFLGDPSAFFWTRTPQYNIDNNRVWIVTTFSALLTVPTYSSTSVRPAIYLSPYTRVDGGNEGSILPSEVNMNIASVATVKGLVEGAAYTMTQAEATDEAAVKAAIENVISGLALDGVTTTVTKVDYTEAVAGTEGTPSGTNGTYTFTVALSKGADERLVADTTATLTMTIIAPAYQAAPTDLDGVAPTGEHSSDGKITGTTTEMEYKLAAADDLTFAGCTDTETTGLEAGDYVVRYAAKPGYNAGAVTAVTVPAYVAPADTTAYNEAKASIPNANIYTTESWTAFSGAILACDLTLTENHAQEILDAETKKIHISLNLLVPLAATSLVPDGTLLTNNSIDLATGVDWFKFDAVAGQKYSIRTSNLGSTDGEIDTVMYLYDKDSITELDFNDDIEVGNYASSIDYTIPSSGTYYVKVVDYEYYGYLTDPDWLILPLAGYIGQYDIAVTNITPTLNSIAITNPANKLTYTVGDSLDISGMVVTGTYSDSSTKMESISTDNVSGFDSSAPVSSQTLTVTVGGKTTTYAIVINPPTLEQNAASVATVKGLVEGATYTMTQAEATDEAAVKAAIESVISGLALDNVTTAVTKVDYTEAVAGTEGTHSGTNGTYTFTVALSKGADETFATDTTATLTMTITATAYVAPATYAVSISTVIGGSITANPATAAVGEMVYLRITPDTGKRLKAGTLRYNDGDETDHAISGTSFVMPAADVTVAAEFETIPIYVEPNQDQAAPTDLEGVVPTSAANNDGKITGTTAAMEYKLSADATWIRATGAEITDLAAGTYNVRYAAKPGYNAGAATVVTVPAYVAPPTEPVMNDDGSATIEPKSPQVITGDDGSVIEETYILDEGIAGQIRAAVEQGASSVDIQLRETASEERPPRTTLTILPEVLSVAALGYDAEQGTGITVRITTAAATLTLPPALVSALAAQGQELTIVIERAELGEVIEDVPQSASAIGGPLSLQTDIQGRTGVTMPMNLTLPEDPAQRAAFLNSLGMLAIHSDGDVGVIYDLELDIDDSVSPPVLRSVSFFVDKFSSFTLIKFPSEPLTTLVNKRGYAVAGKATDMEPCYYRGSDTMMPIRMLEVFGVEFGWDEGAKTATMTYKNNTVSLTIGSVYACINGVKTPIVGASGALIAPELAPGRVMIPLRFVSERLGFKVHWDPSKLITITP